MTDHTSQQTASTPCNTQQASAPPAAHDDDPRIADMVAEGSPCHDKAPDESRANG